MYDEDFDTSAPYDNVEFPVRKPGTGTWPGPGAAATAGVGTGLKLYGHQTTGRTLTGPKLAPLVEVEGSEGNENGRLQTLSFGTPSISSSSSSFSSQQQQLQQQGQSKLSTSSVQQNIITSSETKGDTLSSGSIASSQPSTGLAPTTTSSSTVITTSTSQSGRQSTEKSSKPVIVVTNDSNTYITAQIPSAESPRKKGHRRMDTDNDDEDDFKRHDLNPGSRQALERVYTSHKDFYQLNSKVLEEGGLLKQDVIDIYKKSGEVLTYEQLLQGMLVDGERFLLGSCWLYYTYVQFLDVEGTKTLREPYGRGRVGLTNKRVLFLSNETYTDANVEQFEQVSSDQKKKTPPKPGYKLEVSKRSAITFKNIPINNFHSAELEVITGTAAQTKITKQPSCCSCLGIAGKWVSTPPITRSINSRVLRVGVSMPPWQTRMFLDIHLEPSMSLTVARDFITQLHTFAPHMH